jgi:large subunit ribosomal protein L21
MVTKTAPKTIRKAPPAKGILTTNPTRNSNKEGRIDVVKLAVFATGGKQYVVKLGDKIKIEKIADKIYKEGDRLVFPNVLLTVDNESQVTLGNPFIKDLIITATINKIGRAKKIEVVKYKAKSRYYKKYGHRQPYFEIEIISIR